MSITNTQMSSSKKTNPINNQNKINYTYHGYKITENNTKLKKKVTMPRKKDLNPHWKTFRSYKFCSQIIVLVYTMAK